MADAPRKGSFLFKLGIALAAASAADWLFAFQRVGSTLGFFALALLALAAAASPAARGRPASRVALAAAALFALLLVADPGPLALLLYWTALTLAMLLPRTARFDDGWRWARRLVLHGLFSPFGLARDVLIAARARRRRGPEGLHRKALVLVLPLAGTIVFILLFAAANPVIDAALASIDLSPRLSEESLAQIVFWMFVIVMVWTLVRPPRVRLGPAGAGMDPDFALPGVSPASVLLSLAAFNLLFALQNGLDLAFLWSGAGLPHGMTLAEYAHRGAYPLIATALLAGLFVLVTLRPGSATAASRPIRLLVTLWIAQNLLLVASTMLRTFDYIEAYSLTELRIAALIWMGLVAIGLMLICTRLLRGKSGAWLVNANMAAALLALTAGAAVDLGGIAAGWNVRHAREAGGRGASLDLCYLRALGPSALLHLIELEGRPLPTELRERVAWLRSRAMTDLAARQADWHGWTWQGARRLAAAAALVEANRLPNIGGNRLCDGRPIPPPPAEPLTSPAAE
ncbi:MAG: hypothetical protein QOD42_1914 [Sphingomonadales bacterium]|jgi:hypothetical protein|nr:hypothetical protein [Sphingomonadales bacterium]